MCFCETNPPFWLAVYYVSSSFKNTYIVCRAVLQVGSFWKTNPPEGSFRGVFRENWAHLPRKLHRGLHSSIVFALCPEADATERVPPMAVASGALAPISKSEQALQITDVKRAGRPFYEGTVFDLTMRVRALRPSSVPRNGLAMTSVPPLRQILARCSKPLALVTKRIGVFL